MKFKQFLNEDDSHITDEELSRYKDKFKKNGIDIHLYKLPYTTENFAKKYGINDDKKALFFISNSNYRDFFSESMNKENKEFYFEDEYHTKYWSHSVKNEKLNNINGVEFKFITGDRINKNSPTPSGVLVAFRKNISKYVKQLQFESILNEDRSYDIIKLNKKINEFFGFAHRFIIRNIEKGDWIKEYSILEDKKVIGWTEREILIKFNSSYKNGIDIKSKKIYSKSPYLYDIYSYDVKHNDFKQFSKENNIEIKLITPTDIDEDTEEGEIAGLVFFFEKNKSNSKHVKQLQFEATEPGQQVYDISDKYFIKLTNQKEVNELQKFLNKNHYNGSQPKEVYKIYKDRYVQIRNDNFAIYINIPEKRTEWDRYSWYDGRNGEFGKGYSLEEFKDIVNEDPRIKVKF